MANKPKLIEILLHNVRMSMRIKWKITSVGRVWSSWDPPAGHMKWCGPRGNSLEVFQKVKHRITHQASYSTAGFMPKGTEHTCENWGMDVCAAYSQYPPVEVTQMCLGWRGDKLSVVNPCGGTLFSLKKNKVLINATPRMTLKNMMFSERSQTRSLTLYGSISVKCPKQANAWRGRADGG